MTLTTSVSSFAQKQKIILDTDIGDDFDDANTLALLLSSPEFDIIGVVVDFGNTPKRAQVACRLLYEANRENIPVVVGRQTYDDFTLKHNYTTQFYWGEGFDKLKPIRQKADDFIIEQLHRYPGEVVILTIGPVTNMGDVMDKDPTALKLSKHIFAMFGSFHMGYGGSPVPCAEWNVMGDIKASQKMMSSGANITLVPLDVTVFVRLKKEMIQLLAYRNSRLTNAVLSLFALSSIERKDPEPIIYDSVSLGMIIWPDLFETREAYVRVDDKGFTLVDESKPTNCKIATTINSNVFLERYLERLLIQKMN